MDTWEKIELVLMRSMPFKLYLNLVQILKIEWFYELNIILINKKRIHVFGHPNKKQIKKDAAKLALALSVPLWDVS
jgi:hypothetical protein